MTRRSEFQSPAISLVQQPSRAVGVVVVGLASSGTDAKPVLLGVPAGLRKTYTKQFSADVVDLADDLGASAEIGTVVTLPSTSEGRLVVVGLGEVDVTPDQVRTAAAEGVRAVDRNDKLSGPVAVSFEITDPELVQAAAEGALLGPYRVDTLAAEERPAGPAIEIVSSNTKAEAKDALERGRVVATAVAIARDWVNLPPNLLFPASFAEGATTVLKDAKVAVEVLDEKALAKGGYGGILAVGGGSTRQPRLLRAEYAPRGAKQTLALVGKGITFDSGGLDIKPPDSMYDMKCDMAGAAAVIAATHAIAQLGLPVRVVTYAAMAENMPSGAAYRPSDVLTMYGGLTVENANTDAEGRLVMADALARANEDKPDLVVDVATLTGACMVALGKRIAGLMASSDETADTVLDAAEVAGEPFWQLPVPDQIAKSLTSKIADVKSGADRYGGALAAAAFLHRFVEEDTNWAHLDIAGPAWNDKDAYAEVPVGGTGFSVRTLVALASAMAS